MESQNRKVGVNALAKPPRLCINPCPVTQSSSSQSLSLSLSLSLSMEFKYRAIDVQSPAYLSNSYFTQQPLRGCDGLCSGVVRDHTDSYLILRELEKIKIGGEINSTKIESLKRMLEMEVRREMTLPRGNGFPLYSDSLAMRFGSGLPVLPPYGSRFPEERTTSFFPEELVYQPIRGIREFNHFPFQQNLETGVPAFASNSVVFGKRGSFQAKPEETVSGAKREAVRQPSMAGGPVKGSTIGLFAKKSGNVSKLKQAKPEENISRAKRKVETQPSVFGGPVKGSTIGQFAKKFSNVSKLKQDAQNVVDSEKKNGHSSEQTPKDGNLKQKLKFVCEMCNVRTDTLKVLNRHKRGKKHFGKLLKLAESSAKK